MRRRQALNGGLAGVTGLAGLNGLAGSAVFSGLVAAALPAAGAEPSRSVGLAGQIGRRKALLVIDGAPVTLAVGEARAGVRLRALGDGQAEVELAGRVVLLRQGDAPQRLDGAAAAGADATDAAGRREIVLPMGLGGHFLGSGAINGRPVRFMVDTGASVVALSADEAARIGIDLSSATPVTIGTANGPVPGRRVTLSAVSLGGVTVANVAAVVTPAPMTHVLLGNSFLQRFQLRRDNDVMRLQLR
jgi:aspartyl protease family protein